MKSIIGESISGGVEGGSCQIQHVLAINGRRVERVKDAERSDKRDGTGKPRGHCGAALARQLTRFETNIIIPSAVIIAFISYALFVVSGCSAGIQMHGELRNARFSHSLEKAETREQIIRQFGNPQETGMKDGQQVDTYDILSENESGGGRPMNSSLNYAALSAFTLGLAEPLLVPLVMYDTKYHPCHLEITYASNLRVESWRVTTPPNPGFQNPYCPSFD